MIPDKIFQIYFWLKRHAITIFWNVEGRAAHRPKKKKKKKKKKKVHTTPPPYRQVELATWEVLFTLTITKTRLYNLDPLKPHFYKVKLGFTGVYTIFLISAQNIDCGYSLEPPRRGGSNEYLQSIFWAEIRKISEIFIWNFSFFLGGKIFYIFE